MQKHDESAALAQGYDRRATRALGFLALAATGYISGIQLDIVAAQHPRLYLSYWVSITVIGVDLVATTLAAALAEAEFYLMMVSERENRALLTDDATVAQRGPFGVRLGLWLQRFLRKRSRDDTLSKFWFDIATYIPVGSLWWFSIWALFNAGLGSAISRFIGGG